MLQDQEVADGHLLLHATHAVGEGYEAVVIYSEDTDVFIICVPPLFQKCATRNRTCVVDIRTVAATIGIDVCRALICMHTLDVTLSVLFSGKGKANALKLLTSNMKTKDTFLELGQQLDLSPELMVKLEAFTCLLYARKSSYTNY